jgi:hypothetical protein
MKKSLSQSPHLAFLALLLAAIFQSCNILVGLPGSEGELRIAFAQGQELLTRSGLEIPDTSDFILSVKDSKGNIVYDGPYGASPEALKLKSGSYTVRVISEEFPKPAFSLPQFGDEQCVVVSAGDVVNLKLVCRQVNAGIRLKIDSGFLTKYPDGSLILKSSFGRLLYGYAEKRIAYFQPGSISLVLANGGTDEVLLTKTLLAQEILELKVKVSSAGSPSTESSRTDGISVSVDTSRVWLSDEYIIGGGLSSGGVLSVAEAVDRAGEEDVWVCGYIVGGDLTSSSASFSKPFTSRTNIVLGPRSSTNEKSSCLSVQLPSGELREALNLVDNPEILGRKVCLRGDIVEAYYGIPGIKNISDYELQ